VIDTATNTVVTTALVAWYKHTVEDISHDWAFSYVTSVSNTVSVIDIATNIVVATVPVGSQPVGVAITPF
jgi:YVTN family beta-propeller protein